MRKEYIIKIQNVYNILCGEDVMLTKLYRIETYGMKNLKNSIVINFQSQTPMQGKSKKNISKIKAIYGSNGSGKTAIVQSVYFYKMIVSDYDFLKQKDIIEKLHNLINKETNIFYINVVFGFDDDLSRGVYKHELSLSYDENEKKVFINFEKLSVLKDQTINGEYSTVFETNDGDLKICDNANNEFAKLLFNNTKNLLRSSSLISMMYNKEILNKFIEIYTKIDDSIIKQNKTLMSLAKTIIFTRNITVFLNNEDIKFDSSILNINDFVETLLKNKSFFENKISSYEDIILKKNLKEYENSINKLTGFLKLFKPELNRIDLEIKEDGELLHCKKIMNYKNYLVDTVFESTGIRKLMRIYTFLEGAINGEIVFIDELDANISSIYLNKFLEYSQKRGKGQLCFTTHNIFAMNYLYTLSLSLDFIGDTGKLVSWRKNGNYKPYNLYPEGMIEDSPFNVEYFDFISVFENVED